MSDSVGLKDFKIPIGRVAPLTVFQSRGGESLSYRLYPAWSENLLVLIHGIGGDSRYMCLAASRIAEAGIATVVTPDLRGHGTEPHGPRASVVKESQLEQDLEEMLIHVRMNRPAERVAWGGHSLGAGLAMRMGLLTRSPMLLISPLLPESARASRPDFGGWMSESGDLFRVNMPEIFRTGSEVLEYERSFLAAATPASDWRERVMESGRIRVVVGDRDQVFDADLTEQFFSPLPQAKLRRVDTHHLGVVATPAAIEAVIESGQELF